jgi:hypothetical protein
MKIAGAPEGIVRATGARASASQEIRCPSCARLLVFRAGPAIRPHFAHRPRQSCRNRPGRPIGTPLRLEQLTLFELEIPPPPEPPVSLDPFEPALRRRRRRRAWLPRLIRWLKAQAR